MNQNDLPSEMLEELPTQQTLNFEYGILDAETRMFVQKCTNEIKSLMRRTSKDIIDIGQRLIQVKQHLGHGSFTNWLKSEFNWSISAATKFMQVGEQFKSVNFTNLNITASALYLIAAPSAPKQARAEVLERASLGENISYSKAKIIICQHKKTANSKFKEVVTVDVPAKTTESNYCKSTESAEYETEAVFSMTEQLNGKEAQVKMCSGSSKNSLPHAAFEHQQIATTVEEVCDKHYMYPTNIVNLATISQERLDAVIMEMAIRIKNLTPVQLALVITESTNIGLSDRHLEAIITATQQALKSRNKVLSGR